MIVKRTKKAVVLAIGAVVVIPFIVGAILGIAVAAGAERDRGTDIPVVEHPERAA